MSFGFRFFSYLDDSVVAATFNKINNFGIKANVNKVLFKYIKNNIYKWAKEFLTANVTHLTTL